MSYLADLPCFHLPWFDTTRTLASELLHRKEVKSPHSPRIIKKLFRGNSTNTLTTNRNSPLVDRKDTINHYSENKSAQNSPVTHRSNWGKNLRPRPKSLSDDQMNNDSDSIFERKSLLSQQRNSNEGLLLQENSNNFEENSENFETVPLVSHAPQNDEYHEVDEISGSQMPSAIV